MFDEASCLHVSVLPLPTAGGSVHGASNHVTCRMWFECRCVVSATWLLLLTGKPILAVNSVDLQGLQLAELLAADHLNVLASFELAVRVMCRPRPSEEQARMNLNADLACLTLWLSLLARDWELLSEAVGCSGRDSARLLRRLTSLLVTGMKAALAVMHSSSTIWKPGLYLKLTEATGEGWVVLGLLPPWSELRLAGGCFAHWPALCCQSCATWHLLHWVRAMPGHPSRSNTRLMLAVLIVDRRC
jgi:hypothetical protein